MWYVYYEYVKSGKQVFIKVFDSAQQAIEHIARCYRMDKEINQLGEYYYFMKQR